MVLYQLAEAGFAVQDSLGGAKDVVTVGEETGEVGWGVGGDVEDVPDCCDGREGRVLEGYAEGGAVWGDGDMQGACSLALASNNALDELMKVMGQGEERSYLCAPESEGDSASSTVAHFLGKETGI